MIKSTALIYGGYPLLTEHYRLETLDQLWKGLAYQEFVIAFVCRFQVILSHGYINFPTIDDLRQILLDRYLRIGLESGDQVPCFTALNS
jgi:hypothetical protein